VRLAADGLQKARALAEWRRQLTRGWGQVRVVNVDTGVSDPMRVGGNLEVKAKVSLGGPSPDDVQVQLFHGLVGSPGEVPQPHTVAMSANGATREGSTWQFSGITPCRSSGQHGFAVRVLPRHGDLDNPYEPGLVTWG
jgi:glycogen phosphorylase